MCPLTSSNNYKNNSKMSALAVKVPDSIKKLSITKPTWSSCLFGSNGVPKMNKL